MKGFGLIETLVYVAVLSVLLFVIVNSVLVASNAFGEARTDRLILLQGGNAMERMLREIRLADGVDILGSVLGAHPGRLKVNTVLNAGSETATTKEFFLSTETLMLRVGGVDPSELTNGVRITNLVFYATSTEAPSEAVRALMTVEAGEGRFEESHTFYGTAVLRRSY